MPNIIQKLDYWTQLTLSIIWKEQVQECIKNDIETGKVEDSDDWQFIQHTPFTEPFWGVVANK
tara:strand:- start:41 stop:229 length:189 start_codon:yes stop_codon:yes gene_type:complete